MRIGVKPTGYGWALVLLLLLPSCHPQSAYKHKNRNQLNSDRLEAISLADTLDGTTVHIERPANWTGQCLLALHGWNLSALDWKTQTPLVELATRKGIAVVMPELGKTIYASRLYPETRVEWRSQRLLGWVSDTLVGWLQTKYGLFSTNRNHAVLGLSTGGRGAVLVAAARSDVFTACGVCSGDFIPELMPADNLMRGWYGSFEEFPDRWRGSEHPVGVVHKIKGWVYVAHGASDAVVPIGQSRSFLLLLAQRQPELQLQSWLPDFAGHDYVFWGACTSQFLTNWLDHTQP